MAKHKNVIHLSEVPSETMKVPEGSSFGGVRQRVGMAIGARKLGYSFFTVPPEKAAFPAKARKHFAALFQWSETLKTATKWWTHRLT